MRRVPCAAAFAVTALLLGQAGGVAADQAVGLQRNPFTRPVLPTEPVDTAPGRPGSVVEAPPVLSGTLVSASAPMAILDGKLLMIGGEHAGYRLVAVEEGTAVFERGGEAVRFQVAVPVPEATGRPR